MLSPDCFHALTIGLGLLFCAAGAAGASAGAGEDSAASPRLHDLFDADWRFHRGDAPEAWQPGFDDSAWRAVDLPHDWSVEDLPAAAERAPADSNEATGAPTPSGPFDPAAEGGGAQAFTVGGIGWYRKSFALPEALRGRSLWLTFEGVYMCAEVWLNGERLGDHPYGYTTFRFDIAPHARFGEPNVLAVKVDASLKTSRWYPGAGIYRHVWLTAANPVHIAQWGTRASTVEASGDQALVRVLTSVVNKGSEVAGGLVLSTRLVDAHGSAAATAKEDVPPPAAGSAEDLAQDLAVDKPALWSPDAPNLYRLVSTLSAGGEVIDEIETTFGLREIEIDAAQGFRINGQRLKLRGGCVHHDNGCLGACAYDRAEERRVELLKAAGFNAIRTAHNPPSPAFLDACDRLGMIVIDEAFDCWQAGKSPGDYHRFFDDWWRHDLESMVCRDRNHPSVVFWSIGNEVPEQGTPAGAHLGDELARYVRALDPTRPVVIGAHPGTAPWEDMDPLFATLDACGYNYKDDRYVPDHERVPERVILGTESFPAHCFEQLMVTEDSPWVVGDFVWTSLDYLGESALGGTHYDDEPKGYQTWPWTVSNCGDLDLCCWRRPQSYYREVCWHLGPRVACFVQTSLPPGRKTEHVDGWGWRDEQASWTWPGEEGKPLTVRVYSSCQRVRLSLGGRDLGVKPTGRAERFTATYELPYEPGELVAVGLDGDGQEVARWVLRTAGAPAGLRLTPDRPTIAAGGEDLCFVTVEVLDAAGILDPNADDLVRFSVDGPARIVGVGSADPASVESFQQPRRKAYRGRCLVVLKAEGGPGEVHLRAESDGLAGATATIRTAAQ